jgi:hypothetical protein
VYCPRCGTPYEAGDRFCGSCGATLDRSAGKPSEPRSLRERAGSLAGTTRRARIVTLATVAAIVVAIVAAVALGPGGNDTIPRDAYTIAADGMCLDAKRQIVAAERASAGNLDAFARSLVPVVASWRSSFRNLRVPSDRFDRAAALDAGLRDVEIEASRLALMPDSAPRSRALAEAGRVDAASRHVERAISELGLARCAAARIGISTGNKG